MHAIPKAARCKHWSLWSQGTLRVRAAGKIILTPVQLLYRLEVSSPLEIVEVTGKAAKAQDVPELPQEVTVTCDDSKEVITRFGRKVKTPERFVPGK